MGARGSELIALSKADHNLEFTTLESGAKHVSIRLVCKFIPTNQRPNLIPKSLEFPDIAHLFPQEHERLLCPVRALSLYLVRSVERAKEDPHERLFVHFSLDSQLFTTHFRFWVTKTICITYKNSSESDFPKVRAHDVRAVAASITYYWNTPLSELCGLIRWKSSKFSSANTSRMWQPTLNCKTSHLWHPGQPCPRGRFLSYSSLTTSTNVS